MSRGAIKRPSIILRNVQGKKILPGLEAGARIGPVGIRHLIYRAVQGAGDFRRRVLEGSAQLQERKYFPQSVWCGRSDSNRHSFWEWHFETGACI